MVTILLDVVCLVVLINYRPENYVSRLSLVVEFELHLKSFYLVSLTFFGVVFLNKRDS